MKYIVLAIIQYEKENFDLDSCIKSIAMSLAFGASLWLIMENVLLYQSIESYSKNLTGDPESVARQYKGFIDSLRNVISQLILNLYPSKAGVAVGLAPTILLIVSLYQGHVTSLRLSWVPYSSVLLGLVTVINLIISIIRLQ